MQMQGLDSRPIRGWILSLSALLLLVSSSAARAQAMPYPATRRSAVVLYCDPLQDG